MAVFTNDVEILRANLPMVPKTWDGKRCILELKEADYNWRQMEGGRSILNTKFGSC
ncbi:MAG: hypothetical protein LBU65_15255 [Planctomycetaceae bacterium]|nr:hypothetical protein [Planctomycetaceae bacterium]